MTTEPLPAATSASHLTDVLRRSGLLTRGAVRAVVADGSLAKLRSYNVRLRLSYDGTGDDAPTSVFLKTGHLGDARANTGQAEVRFYTDVAPAAPDGLLPRCFEAQWEKESGNWHLLLEDLGASHSLATEWPVPPTLDQCERIVDARARFHAAWWNHPRLGVDIGQRPDIAAIAPYLQSLAAQFVRFIDRYPELMSPRRRELFEQLLARASKLQALPRRYANLTIIHGDAHVWNCMLPRDGSSDVRLIDWEVWRVDRAAADLAYMMAVHWYPDVRQRMERNLLDRYHATLLRHGVGHYDRAALDLDYRFAVLWHIATPIWQSANNIPARVWWNNLERIFMAVDDLKCRDLLD